MSKRSEEQKLGLAVRVALRLGFKSKGGSDRRVALAIAIMAAICSAPIQYAYAAPQPEIDSRTALEKASLAEAQLAEAPMAEAPSFEDVFEQTELFDFVAHDLLESLDSKDPGWSLRGCSGRFVDPLMQGSTGTDALGLSSTLSDQDLIIDADTASTDGDLARLDGNVKLTQGLRQVTSDSLQYDQRTGVGSLNGKVTIRQPGVRINGSRALMNAASSEATFSDASFVLHRRHIIGAAKSIKQTSDDKVILSSGRFTSCEPPEPAWEFRGDEIGIDRRSQVGYGKNLSLRIKDVPVLWLPYITFPIGDQRKSGLLFPTIGSSERGGFDISVPYYFNLAPNYDLTLAPRLMTGRGLMLEGEARHLSRRFTSSLSAGYLNDDRDSNDSELQSRIDAGLINESQARPNLGDDRWTIDFKQIGGSTTLGSWYSEIDYSRVSDINYFRDFGDSFGNASLRSGSQSYLSQSGILGFRQKHFDLSVGAQDFDVLLIGLDSPYRRLPEIKANLFYDFADLNSLYEIQHTRFSHDNRDQITGERLRQKITLDYRYERPWAFANPEVGMQSLSYRLDSNSVKGTADTSPEFYTPEASLDTGLIFEKRSAESVSLIKPRAFFLYREFEDQSSIEGIGLNEQSLNFDTQVRTFSYDQLYRDTRFAGYDRLDDANSLTLGVSYENRDAANYRERYRISLGQIFHFEDRKVLLGDTGQGIRSEVDDAQRSSSELAGEFRMAIGDSSQFNAAVVYDTNNTEINRATFALHLADKKHRNIFNIQYSYLREAFSGAVSREDIDQIDLSILQNIKPQWSWFARYNYDLGFSQELESFLGLEYDDCCYKARFMARRWLDSNIAEFLRDDEIRFDQGVFFEFELKGLGGSGKRITRLLEDGIYGFHRRAR